MAICEQLDKAKKSRAVRGNREQRILVVPEMCEGCTAYMGEGYRCPVQKSLVGCGYTRRNVGRRGLIQRWTDRLKRILTGIDSGGVGCELEVRLS